MVYLRPTSPHSLLSPASGREVIERGFGKFFAKIPFATPSKSTKNSLFLLFPNGQVLRLKPTWNWKLNIDGGLALFASKCASALAYLGQTRPRTKTKPKSNCTSAIVAASMPRLLRMRIGNIQGYVMPITFWVKTWLTTLFACGVVFSAHADVAPALPKLKLSYQAGQAKLELKPESGKAQTLLLKTDAYVNPASHSATLELIAALPHTLVLQDSYASRPASLAMCQAGQESFLRVIRRVPLKEMLRIKLASCRENIELATPGLTWQAETASLHIHWLSGPNQGEQQQKLQIDRDGKPSLSAP